MCQELEDRIGKLESECVHERHGGVFVDGESSIEQIRNRDPYASGMKNFDPDAAGGAFPSHNRKDALGVLDHQDLHHRGRAKENKEARMMGRSYSKVCLHVVVRSKSFHSKGG